MTAPSTYPGEDPERGPFPDATDPSTEWEFLARQERNKKYDREDMNDRLNLETCGMCGTRKVQFKSVIQCPVCDRLHRMTDPNFRPTRTRFDQT